MAFDALDLAPDLIEHIASLITMQGSSDSEVRASRVHAQAPLNVDALDTVDRLSGRIIWWAHHWAFVLQVPAPADEARVTSPADDPAAARAAVLPSAQWLLQHLDEIFRRIPDDVHYFVDELTEVHQAANRYPMLHQPRYTELRCRTLGCNGTVALWPFVEVKKWKQEGQHVFLPPEGARILCNECGDRWTEAEYTDEVHRRVEAIKEEQKSQRVAHRLMKKYGPPSQYPLFFGAVAGKVRHGHTQKMIGDPASDLTKSSENQVG
ncbi:hypothetical protein P9139_18030 [Curtobacterium flaccumfaciens]|nr:hypothetical protein P9139_18030 [Curtobacterium flaccumfaciens]